MDNKIIIPPKTPPKKVKGELSFEMSIDLETGQFSPVFPKSKNEQAEHLATIASLMNAFRIIDEGIKQNKSRIILMGNEHKVHEGEMALKIIAEFIAVAGKRYLDNCNPPKKEEGVKDNEKKPDDNNTPTMNVVK